MKTEMGRELNQPYRNRW